jgi:BlaI family transcriptional regulator, penicillinase repressor
MPESVNITDAEWAVMEVVWNAGKVGAAEVIEALEPTRKWSHRTIRTLLARLVEKGALSAQEDGHRYLYGAAVTRQRCVRSESRSFLDKVFGGDVSSLMLHFAKESRMSPADVERLKRILDQSERQD